MIGILICAGLTAGASEFDIQVLATNGSDPDLVNAWGLTASPTSPFWIGANGSGKALVYNGAGTKLGLTVTIPGDGSVTGATFNGSSGFDGDSFLFASEDGTVSGWRGALGTAAETLVGADPSSVYKGIADASVGGFDYAYLANFRTGAIDVLKGEGGAPDLAGSFTDPDLPAGYAPFDVQNLGGVLYVTYAVQDAAKKDDVAALGNGIVDTFDLNGNFLGRVVTGGLLDSPWGLAIAPAGFGDVGGDLLVGNFGNGRINAYNPTTGTFVETLAGAGGTALTIDGLWGLRFGNGGAAGSTQTLYFTAGPNDEQDGAFGDITSPVGSTVPEPATWVLLSAALVCLCCGRIVGNDRLNQSSHRRDSEDVPGADC
ncbi:MAG TPA: TIGR03118 family protein [Candidatus Sulfopaludibacter sp.]|nr:TIGR03118 family protein [Candidatus Sulfopaludibacter sp.]